VSDGVVDALKKNMAFVLPSEKGLTIQQLFGVLRRLFKEAEDDELTFDDLSDEISELINGNAHLLLAKKIMDTLGDMEDITLLLFFCHKLINEDDDAIGFWHMERIYDEETADFGSTKRSFKNENHSLFTLDLVESKKNDDLLSRDYYCLTGRAKSELLSELNINVVGQKKPKDILFAKDITERPLYYNSREQGQIDQLVKLLDGENFAKVQRRLEKNGMRKGFACLFHGAPGTGKTETVYQIARRTGRDILTVNVSEIKSMWVGESEKNIKSLFDKYRNFCKQSAAVPILLFNEADAVLGVRSQGAERAVDKMENSIQNIILQEMETLEGIMIATTNLTQNLDPAFERRFLFKIEFDKPGLEAKTAIWQAMMPELSESAAAELALAYSFSGGQIENIARKRTVDQIIQGRRPKLSQIHDYCKSEQINNKKERRPIGF
jgi:DNA polymerase III delta prime subunit